MNGPRNMRRRLRRWEGTMASNEWGYVGASYALTWIVLFLMLARVLGAVRRAKAEYESAVKGGYKP